MRLDDPLAGNTAATTLPVVVRGVSKDYAGGESVVHALDDVSLSVRAGEMVALVGPSGCGKSTLLNLVGCVDLPSRGEVLIDGIATTSLDDDALTILRRDRVGTIFQFFNLLPALSIAANVGLPLTLQHLPPREITARVEAALALVGLGDKSRAFPAQVSGGQMQRAAIARSIVHRPAILLADEPTGNLDSENGKNVLRLLRSFAESGQAILMATHSAEAAGVCDRTVAMRDGRIIG